MSAREILPASTGASGSVQSVFRVELSLSVSDGVALWAAAAEKGLAAAGANLEDLCEVIGPREDPDLPACIAMLTAPIGVAGCRLHDFHVTEPHAGHAVPPANDLAVAQARHDASA